MVSVGVRVVSVGVGVLGLGLGWLALGLALGLTDWLLVLGSALVTSTSASTTLWRM